MRCYNTKKWWYPGDPASGGKGKNAGEGTVAGDCGGDRGDIGLSRSYRFAFFLAVARRAFLGLVALVIFPVAL